MSSPMIATGTIRNLFSGVNRAADVHNLTELEKKHIPIIEAPDTIKQGNSFAVKIEVGKMLPHPNERSHFIEFIDLYADAFFLARVDLTAVNTDPLAVLRVSLISPAKELRAYARCNVHGVWIGTAPITVMQ